MGVYLTIRTVFTIDAAAPATAGPVEGGGRSGWSLSSYFIVGSGPAQDSASRDFYICNEHGFFLRWDPMGD